MCNISRECVYLLRRRNIVGEATSFVRSTTLFAEGNLVLCPLIYNDVLVLLEMMLTASGQTMLCPADTNTKNKALLSKCFIFCDRLSDLNPAQPFRFRSRSGRANNPSCVYIPWVFPTFAKQQAFRSAALPDRVWPLFLPPCCFILHSGRTRVGSNPCGNHG